MALVATQGKAARSSPHASLTRLGGAPQVRICLRQRAPAQGCNPEPQQVPALIQCLAQPQQPDLVHMPDASSVGKAACWTLQWDKALSKQGRGHLGGTRNSTAGAVEVASYAKTPSGLPQVCNTQHRWQGSRAGLPSMAKRVA